MNSEYKYNAWVMTIMSNADNPLLPVENVIETMKALCSEYTFQKEEGEQGMLHYQCAFKTKIRQRQRTVLKDFSKLLDYPEFLLNVDKAQDYDTAVVYCSSQTKRVTGEVAYSNIHRISYNGEDVLFLADRDNRFPWQNEFMSLFFTDDEADYKPGSSRCIHWIADPEGKSGKSTFTKFLRYNYDYNYKVPWGTPNQIRTSIVERGAQKMYILDCPRTLDSVSSLDAFFSVIEDAKNGYISTAMHGNPRELLMAPPHVVIFSNQLPNLKYLSDDRWQIYVITPLKQLDWQSSLSATQGEH